MKFSNLFEKLKIIFNLIADSNNFTCLLFLIVGILLLRLNKKISNKKMSILIYLVEILSLGIIFYENKNFIIDTVNKIIDSVFLNFYFPSIYVYLFILIISIILFLYTLINPIISKIYKIITNTYFLTLNFIFALLINVISKNNIDIFTKESLFTNNNILVLLELSTLLFFIYIVVTGLVYFTNSLIIMVGNRIVTNEKYNNELTIEVPVEEKEFEEVVDNKKVSVSFQELVKNIENVETTPIEENITSIEILESIEPIVENTKKIIEQKEKTIEKFIPKINLVPELKMVEETDVILDISKEFKFVDPILLEEPFANNVIEMNSSDNLKEKLNFIDFSILEKKDEESLTLKDYKLFSTMLKTVIQNNNNSNITISDILNESLSTTYSFEEYSKFEKILNSSLN